MRQKNKTKLKKDQQNKNNQSMAGRMRVAQPALFPTAFFVPPKHEPFGRFEPPPAPTTCCSHCLEVAECSDPQHTVSDPFFKHRDGHIKVFNRTSTGFKERDITTQPFF